MIDTDDTPKKKPKKPRSNTRARAEVKAERLAIVEQVLLNRMGGPRTQIELGKKWGVNARQVRKYMTEVRKRWRAEAEALGPDERLARRDGWRASLEQVFAKAMTRTVVITDSVGGPLLKKDGTPLTREVPDLKNAIAAAKLCIDLDGLAAPAKTQVEITDATTPIKERSADELVEYLRTGVLRAAAAVPTNGGGNGAIH